MLQSGDLFWMDSSSKFPSEYSSSYFGVWGLKGTGITSGYLLSGLEEMGDVGLESKKNLRKPQTDMLTEDVTPEMITRILDCINALGPGDLLNSSEEFSPLTKVESLAGLSGEESGYSSLG